MKGYHLVSCFVATYCIMLTIAASILFSFLNNIKNGKYKKRN
jgi:hypothetical protein